MDKQECLNADWHMVGIEDGSLGKPMTVLGNYRKDCSKVDIVPDREAYERGHKEGLVRYCIYENGLRLGERGGKPAVNCPKGEGDAFYTGYLLGKDIYSAQQAVNRLESSIQNKKDDLHDIDLEIDSHEKFLVNAQGDNQSRREAIEDIKRLKLDWQVIHQELNALEDDLIWAQDDLEALRSKVDVSQ